MRIIGLSDLGNAPPTIASSKRDKLDENTGETIKIEGLEWHSCDAAHVMFSSATDASNTDRVNRVAKTKNLDIRIWSLPSLF